MLYTHPNQGFAGQVSESLHNCESENSVLLDETYLIFIPVGGLGKCEEHVISSQIYIFSLTTADLGNTSRTHSFLALKALCFSNNHLVLFLQPLPSDVMS